MTKISAVLTGLLVLGAIAPNAAFAAMSSSRAAVSQGEAVNQCRSMEDQSMNNHHASPAIQACVQRLEQINHTTAD